MKRLLLLFLSTFYLLYGKSDYEEKEIETFALETETIAEKYNNYFNFGTCIAAGEYYYSDITTINDNILDQYNAFSPENSMKPNIIRNWGKSWNWTHADNYVEFAKSKNSLIRGHVLLWHLDTPEWMTEGSKEQVRANLKDHISTLVGRYKDDIHTWDVVNEAVSDIYGYRKNSPWYKAYGGPEYIGDAFIMASKADPDCLLFYNDYYLAMPHKRKMVVKMIKDLDLIEKGLDGIGIQAHWSLTWPSLKAIEETIDTFHDMGLLVEITELDITCYSRFRENEKEKPYDYKLQEKLAKRYREIFELLRRKSDKINGVTMWGIKDDNSWLNNFRGLKFYSEKRSNYPLLFNEHQEPKKAYKEIMDF